MLLLLAAGCATTQMPALVETDIKVGKGEKIAQGKMVLVHFTGWLYDEKAANHHGKKFDSSRDMGRRPLKFRFGMKQVIAGWDQGLAGMRVGGRRTLIVPPELAYGDSGTGKLIPPHATLVFDVELLGVQ
ncbi:MAG: FKBP-type peptidyl-prolyl cis-trans isomerase [Nitrosomonadales bacterium]|nr:FKBP-type peptidyl-prolyl cis-trans isomerase [Nitrosomonadales bacterium]